MKSILFLDKGTLAGHTLTFDFPHKLDELENCPASEVAKALQGYEIAITNKVPIGRAEIEANPQLKLIAIAATGFNHIDIEAAKELGVTVCNVAGYSTVSVAERAFLFMLALMHRLPLYQKSIAAGAWPKSPFFSLFEAPIYDLKGKNLVIAGKGEIGAQLGRYAEAFGVNLYYAERKGADQVREGYISFEEALTLADIFSVHTPLTPETENMIDVAEIEKMRDGVLLINVSRGGIMNEEAIANALRSGKVGGVAVDVMREEPPKEDNPLLVEDLGNLIITPHTAWGSEESLKALCAILEENIERFVAGNPQNVVTL